MRIHKNSPFPDTGTTHNTMAKKQQQQNINTKPTITRPFVSWYTEGVHIIDPSRKASVEVARFIEGKEADGKTWLMNVYTAPEYRNRGMATRLIEAAKNYCRKKSVKALYVWCEMYKIPFYEKRGFRNIHKFGIQKDGTVVYSMVCPICSGEGNRNN